MARRLFVIMLLSVGLVACKGIDGVFLPGCAAYAGDRIELQGGIFTWSKFTDQVRVNAMGERIDPFPGYPRTGTYQIDGNVVTMVMQDDGTAANFFLHTDEGRLLLLTEIQQEHWESSGQFDECALIRTVED